MHILSFSEAAVTEISEGWMTFSLFFSDTLQLVLGSKVTLIVRKPLMGQCLLGDEVLGAECLGDIWPQAWVMF